MTSLLSFCLITQMSIPRHYSLVKVFKKSLCMSFKSPLILKFPIHLILFFSIYLFKNLDHLTCRVSHSLDFPDCIFMVQYNTYLPGFSTAKLLFSLFIFIFWPRCTACGILVPWSEIEPRPWQWKHQVLATGWPGKSLFSLFK